MASPDQLRRAESELRDLLEREGLPPPDEIEQQDGAIVLLWHGPKLAVVIEATSLPPGS